jgi:hypothetical protein
MASRDIFDVGIKCFGAIVLGTAILWQIVEHSGPPRCQVVVHVTEDDVDVEVDGWDYRVKSTMASPIVLDLRPGRHTLRMSRRGRLLYEESFTLRPGRDVVLTAWDEGNRQTATPSPGPATAGSLPFSTTGG